VCVRDVSAPQNKMIATCCDVSLYRAKSSFARIAMRGNILSGGSSTHRTRDLFSMKRAKCSRAKKYYSIEKNHVSWRACYEHIFIARDISFLSVSRIKHARVQVPRQARDDNSTRAKGRKTAQRSARERYGRKREREREREREERKRERKREEKLTSFVN